MAKIVFAWTATVTKEDWWRKYDALQYCIYKFAEEGHEVHVICRGEDEYFKHNNVHFHLNKYITDKIEVILPDVLHITDRYSALVDTCRSFKFRKYISDAGGVSFTGNYLNYDGVIVTRKYQVPLVNYDKVFVIPLGADLERFKPDPTIKKEYDVICVANNVSAKRLGYLLTYQAKMEFKLLLIGEGVKALGNSQMTNVTLMERIPNAGLPYYLNASKVFAMTSDATDTGARVISEAMGCGLPMICLNDTLGMSSLIEEADCGIVATPQDFEYNMKALLNDQSLREGLGKNAREYAERELGYELCYERYKKVLLKDIVNAVP